MFLQLAYKNLDLYNLSKKMVIACYELTQYLPEENTNQIKLQLRASALSAYIHIVRGLFRKSKKKRKEYLKIALRSLSEVDSYLELLFQTKHIRREQMDEIENSLLPCYQLLKKLMKN